MRYHICILQFLDFRIWPVSQKRRTKNFFLEGSVISKLANGHFAMLNSSVALVEVPSIGT